MANKFPLTVNTSTKVIEELSSGDNLNLSGSGIYDGSSLGNTGDFLRKKSGGGVEWSSVAPGSIPVPVASETTIGGIKVGQNLSIDTNGVLSANLGCYTLPIASSTVLGGIKIGSGLSINPITGVVSASQFSLPIAAASTLGGIKVGNGLNIDSNGVLSSALSIASTSALGLIKVGNGLNIDGSGVLSVNIIGTLPIASAASLGAIRIGSGLSIDGIGVLSAIPYSLPTASPTVLGGVKIGGGLSINSSGVLSASGLSSRSTVSYTTSSLAVNAADSIATFDGFKSYAILQIQTSAAAWVTLYTNASSRTLDGIRPDSVDPLPGSGVIAEVITTGSQTVTLTPGTFGFNSESPATTTIYAKIVNKGSTTTTISVTLTLLKLEV